MRLSLEIIETGDRPETVPAKVDKGMIKFLRQAGELLRADIVRNRLNKPRTGLATKSGIGSGPPQYPQVLSVRTGRLRNSIAYIIEENPGGAIMRLGTNIHYGAIWERKQIGNRQWLEPAIRDNLREIEDKFGVTIMREIEK